MKNLIVINKTSKELGFISDDDYNNDVIILGSIKHKGVLVKFHSMSTECNDFCEGSLNEVLETLKDEVVNFIEF